MELVGDFHFACLITQANIKFEAGILRAGFVFVINEDYSITNFCVRMF